MKWEVELEVHFVEVTHEKWEHVLKKFLDLCRTCEYQREKAEKGESDHE